MSVVFNSSMADLDDFFAKKDKKKSKKPKFLTAEELVKNLEETKREVVKPKKPETLTATTINQAPAAANDGAEVEEKIVEQVSNNNGDDKDRKVLLMSGRAYASSEKPT